MKNINTKVVVSELHRAFNMFNDNLFGGELPEPAILIQSRGNKKLTLGWCSVQQIWHNEATKEDKYEINIVAEALNRGIYPVMTTLLHEMVHLHNLVKEIKDVSRGNTYHNTKFKQTAEEHGLIIEYADKIGWSVSTLAGTTMDLIDKHKFEDAVFKLGRKEFNEEDKPKKKKTSSRKYVCPECGVSVRASKDVFLLCGDCTDIEENHIVPMLKEVDEDDEETEAMEVVCVSCGCITTEDKVFNGLCPECGCPIDGESEEEPTEEPAEEPEEEQAEKPESFPVKLIEVDVPEDLQGVTEDVKQIMIEVPTAGKTEWTEEAIREVMTATAKDLESKGHEYLDFNEVPIIIKNLKSYGICKYDFKKTKGRGSDKLYIKSLTFSKSHLENDSDADVIDTIKHEFIHAYVNTMRNANQGHNELWKRYCTFVGCTPKATF